MQQTKNAISWLSTPRGKEEIWRNFGESFTLPKCLTYLKTSFCSHDRQNLKFEV